MVEILKKYLSVPAAIAVLGAVYLTLAALVWVTRSARPLVRLKLLVGGLIVSLYTMTGAPTYAEGTCYEPAPPKPSLRFLPPSEDRGNLKVLELRKGSDLAVVIENARSYTLFYELVRDGRVVLQGPVLPLDGKMDSATEWAKISLDAAALTVGTYELRLHRGVSEGSGQWRSMEVLNRYRVLIRSI